MTLHIVNDGETLSDIAMSYYNNPDEWRRILNANLETIKRERNRYAARRELDGPLEHWIFPGTMLAIPEI